MAPVRPPVRARLDSRSFRAAHVAGIVVARWFGDSTPDEYPPLARFIVDAAREDGASVDLIAIVVPLKGLPSSEHQSAMTVFAKATRDSIASTHVVFLGGGGFWQTIIRSITTALTALVSMHGKVKHEVSLDAALARVCAARGLDTAQVAAVLDQEGIGSTAAGDRVA